MPRTKKNPKSKYHAKKYMVDGIEFDSKKEANRYLELKSLHRRGEIRDLQMQVPFILIPAQYEEKIEYTPKKKKEKIVKKLVEQKVSYVADFVYTRNTGEIVVEDVKGYRKGTAYSVFVIKRKLMLERHGIKVLEV